MSLTGNSIAIMSIGMSCQGSHQIRAQVEHIRNVTGDPSLKVKAMPFDWLITPPASTLSLLRSGTYFPEQDELDFNVSPYWRKHNLYFWHAFKDAEKKFDVPGTYGAVRDTMLMRWERFWNATKAKRVLFVMSNTQNDLAAHCATAGTISADFRASELNAFCNEARTYLGSRAEFMVVTRDDRYIADEKPEAFRLFVHTPDNSRWEGDDSQWAKSFSTALAG